MAIWSELFDLLNRKDPDGFINKGEFVDDKNVNGDFNTDDRLSGSRLWIAYVDEAGNRSKRWIRVKRIENRQFSDYVFAFCELRKAERSFRIDRIVEMADSYGEIHEPKDFFTAFIEAPAGRSSGPSKHSPFGRALKILDIVGHEVMVLAFAAECDGKFVAREANTIMAYVKYKCDQSGLLFSKSDETDLRKWLKIQRPDELSLKTAIHRISLRKSSTAKDLIELTDIVFEADGKIKDEETKAAKLLRTLISEEFYKAAE